MPRLTNDDTRWLAVHHSSLVIYQRPDRTVIEGTLRFHRSFEGVAIEDAYSIRLELPVIDSALPLLTDTGGRLRAVLDSHPEFDGEQVHLHAYTSWKLCLAAPQELRLVYLSNPTLELLFSRYIEPYFYSQSFFEHYGTWPWSHLPHNFGGILEWYDANYLLPGAAKETATEIHKHANKHSAQRAISMVTRARRRDGFVPRNRCLCGSKRNYLQCHPSYIKLALALRS